jgi:phosphonate transport system substrate-binding protein
MQELGSFINLKHHDAVAKAVLKGQYDAGAVKDVIAQKYEKYGLRVLAWSKPIPSVPLVVKKDAPRELVTAVQHALLKLDVKNPADRQLMADWDDEFRYGFATAALDDYADIFATIRTIRKGCGTGCHR